MTTRIVEATAADVDAIAELCEEMDRFYGATEIEPIEDRIAQINTALFDPQASVSALLAWDDTQLVGLASYSLLWPAVGLTHSLFLKELYVTETHRRAGVGQLLMQHLVQTAIDQGHSRVEWMTDTPNRDAQAFYQQLGVEPATSKVFYRLEGTDLDRFATRSSQP